MLSVYLCYPDPHSAEVGQMLTQFAPVKSVLLGSWCGNLTRQSPSLYLQYDVDDKVFCYYIPIILSLCYIYHSSCYYCVPCSCVRPGIQCGLIVRGTFRVSQTVPAPCAPSHCLASCCGCLWGLLQPDLNIPTSSSK